MKDSVDSTTHENQVCKQTTETEIRDVKEKMKLQRAPGVDNVSIAMLKYASPCFVTMLTKVINKTFQEGKVPESLLVGRTTLIDKKSPFMQYKASSDSLHCNIECDHQNNAYKDGRNL